MALAAGLNFLFMPVFVLLPLYVDGVLRANASWYGFLLAGTSGGSLAGLLLAGSVGGREQLRVPMLAGALLGTGVCMAGLGWMDQPVGALGLLAAAGMSRASSTGS